MSLRTTNETAQVFGTTAAATTIVVPAITGTRVAVYRLIFMIGSPGITLTLQDTSGTALSQGFTLAANAPMVLDLSWNGEPWWTTRSGLGLQLFQSGTTTISYGIWQIQSP